MVLCHVLRGGEVLEMGRSSLVTRGGGGWSGDHRTGFMILALVALLCRLDATLAESLSPGNVPWLWCAF